ncbi:MAG: hypothetical protein GF355_00190 [Candidatus Eisenbacteria bacterium]|nr:hypothetical protein [Candidatus Eisenbacteria bacterium]
MRTSIFLMIVGVLLLLQPSSSPAADEGVADALDHREDTRITPRTGVELGYHDETRIIPSPREEFCPGTTLLQNDDGVFENGYAWRTGGVQPPDYGAWAECYDSQFVCGIQFLFTHTGEYEGQTMDVYVWDDAPDGNPSPGPDPGNVVCVLTGIDPGEPAFWPDISEHDIQVCCATDGPHWIGFWGNWPGENEGWFIAADERNPPIVGCPRTNVYPGTGYGEGWTPVNELDLFPRCENLGIREFSGLGDCGPTSLQEASWGRIKALY